MHLSWREASHTDLELLAEWNHQLIRDEGHRNRMTIDQLAARLSQWLHTGYRAVIFSHEEPVAYALFKQDESSLYLRQFFVRRDRRRLRIGHRAMELLRQEVWPHDVRLTVDVLCDNEVGLAFWRSVGFRDYCLTLEILPPSS